MPTRPCWVEISTRALEDNYRTLLKASGPQVELLAIVKADAYGHGLALCAPAALRAGARWLGVTSVEEGARARKLAEEAGFAKAEILVIGGPFAGQGAEVVAHSLTAVVWEHWQLEELAAAAREAGYGAGTLPVHLELDTGMSRQGVGAEGLDGILSRFRDSPLRLDGLMTHLYAADESDGAATRAQMELLGRMVQQVCAAGVRPSWLHVGNSAALLSGDVLDAMRSYCGQSGLRAMARPGLALYGLMPELVGNSESEASPNARELREALRPVLEWKTQVVSVRHVNPGQVVGYNGTFVATEPMLLALLAVGYGDGLKRALSNRGCVLVRGERAPIVGRISMDQTVVDVTDIPDVKAGDEVALLGRQGAETITAKEHAAWAETIPWEIFTSIAARVERRAKDSRW